MGTGERRCVEEIQEETQGLVIPRQLSPAPVVDAAEEAGHRLQRGAWGACSGTVTGESGCRVGG